MSERLISWTCEYLGARDGFAFIERADYHKTDGIRALNSVFMVDARVEVVPDVEFPVHHGARS